MNWQHLKAVVWLRWRLTVNQWKRGGMLNAVIGVILLVAALFTSVFAFFVSLAIGLLVLDDADPTQLMLMWDGIIVAFLFFWLTGLLTELRHSEAISLDNLLHLPISLKETFLLNYASSLVSLSLLVFVPLATGLGVALAVVQGPAMLVLFPLGVTFLVMVTAVTHQFRGWLFALMTNKRRRRTIITITTTLLVLVFQLPNLLNMTVFRSQRNQRRAEEAAARSEMDTKRAQGQITTRQYADQLAEMKKTRAERRRSERHQRYVKISDAAVVTNALLPVGWLAFGARAAAQGRVWPGLLGSLAAFGLGALSLRRSYRTTLRTYLGGFTSRPRATKQVPAETTPGAGKNFLERELPWISGQPAAIALGGFRSLTRAPEGKMLLLTPLILLAIFGAMIFAGRDRAVAEQFRPLLGLGALSVTMLCFVQLLCNMFGFDRDGFRAYVLAPCRRRDLLLGKNLAIAPLTIGTCAVAIVAIQLFQPLHVTHLLATCVQAFTAYLLFCLAGNAVSILAPTAVSSGSLKPVEAKITTVIIHLVTVLVSPLVLLPALAAYGLELLLASIGWQVHLPIYLVLSLAELLAIVWLYRRVLDVEGRWLQAREQRILEIVSTRVE